MFIDPYGLCSEDSSYLKSGLATVAIGVLALDNASGIGFADDWLIPVIATAMGIEAGSQLALLAKKSGKEKASDIPSWSKGETPQPGESGKDFADTLLENKYGKGNFPKGPGSEYNKLKKYGDRR